MVTVFAIQSGLVLNIRMIIKTVPASEIISLRHKILRPNQARETAMYPDDDEFQNFHCAVFLDDQIVSIATFIKESKSDFKGIGFRLRGMATDSTKQKLGLGKAVLIYGLNQCVEKGANYVWCNARQTAFPFYEKMGFEYFGELFDIPGINLHKVMYKYL